MCCGWNIVTPSALGAVVEFLQALVALVTIVAEKTSVWKSKQRLWERRGEIGCWDHGSEVWVGEQTVWRNWWLFWFCPRWFDQRR